MIRLATRADIPRLMEIRNSVRENRLSEPSRVTLADYHWFIDHAGVHAWDEGGLIKGLSAADPRNGSIWALFVDPAFEGQGVAQALIREACKSLITAGHRIARLSTSPGTRAERFYLRNGWTANGFDDRGELRFSKLLVDDNRWSDPYRHAMTEPVTQVPALNTARLRLRCLMIEDAPAAHQAYGDSEAMRFWDMPPSIDLEETERRLKRSLSVDPQWHATWAVLARPDDQLPEDQFIGMVNYHARQPWNRRLALGWILIPRFEGRGYMQEAVRAVLTHCFATLNTHRIEAEIEPANVRSVRLAQRLGFQREGLLRDRLFVADHPRSLQMYSLLRSEWGAMPHGVV